MFADAGHALFVDDAARFNALLAGFITPDRLAVSAPALVPLFLVSLAAVGYETALTRYFAVAKWSEYGYWVISIVMVGFALSGVVLALWRDALRAPWRRGCWRCCRRCWWPTAAIGFHFTTTNPFNPLQLQNPATWAAAALEHRRLLCGLLPFFFLAGVFVSLSFVLNADAHRPWSTATT